MQVRCVDRSCGLFLKRISAGQYVDKKRVDDVLSRRENLRLPWDNPKL